MFHSLRLAAGTWRRKVQCQDEPVCTEFVGGAAVAHTGPEVCAKCLHRACEVLQDVSEREKIYHVISGPTAGRQPKDFVILVSQREPCQPQWVWLWFYLWALWGCSLGCCHLELALGDKRAFYCLRSEIPWLMPEFVQPDLLCNVKVQWNKYTSSQIFSIVQYWFPDSDSLGVVYQEGK